MIEALTSSKYWKATWVSMSLGIFLQFTGINAIMWYSNTILSTI